MAPRFTVIQGGLTDEPGCAALSGARQGMSGAAGRRLAVGLVRDRDAETGRAALPGVVSLAVPHAVQGGRARPWQPSEAEANASVERAAAEAVDRTLRERLGALRQPIHRAETVKPVRRTPRLRLVLAPAQRRPVPTASIIGIRPAEWVSRGPEIRPVTVAPTACGAPPSNPASDAHAAQHPTRVAPAQARLAREPSRWIGRPGALRAAVLRRVEQIAAGTRRLITRGIDAVAAGAGLNGQSAARLVPVRIRPAR